MIKKPNRLLRAITLSTLLLALSGVPQAEEAISAADEAAIQQGHQAYTSGEFKKAIDLWKPLAEKGVAQAQFYLSNVYANGEGVDQDVFSALSWLTSSAQAGFPAAQFNLGNRYYHGRWVEKDFVKAAQWWRKAAENQVSQAAYNLGSLYYHGQGVSKNKDEALHWYRKAANGGSAEAKEALASLEHMQAQPAQKVAANQVQQAKAPTAKPDAPASSRAPEKPVNVSVSTPKESAEWIKGQSAKHYTLQVFAANDLKSIEKFIRGFQANDRLAVFGFVRDSKPMYAVIQGSYGSMAAAKAAESQLVGVSTWKRRFGGIQKILVD